MDTGRAGGCKMY